MLLTEIDRKSSIRAATLPATPSNVGFYYAEEIRGSIVARGRRKWWLMFG